MKKCLLFAVAAVMSLMANAQQIKLMKDPARPAKLAQSTKHYAPAAATADNIWGYYLGSFDNVGGLGTEAAGTFKVAIYVPGDGALKGQKIEGLNLPVLSSNMSNVSVWGGPTLTDTNSLFEQSVASVTAGKYNKVTLATPVEIPAAGMYVGYTFTIASVLNNNDKYPIGLAEDQAAGSLYLGLSATAKLDDYSGAGYGVSALQLFVSGLNLNDYAATIKSIWAPSAAINGEGSIEVLVGADSENGIKTIGYEVVLNGVKSSATKNLEQAVPAGMGKIGVFVANYTAPAEIGTYKGSVKITSVNGKPNEVDQAPVEFSMSTVSRVVPRMTVVEEFTGTGCGYCPRGWIGMEILKENYSDICNVIAWHKYNSQDAMYNATYANLSFSGAPQCTVDRKSYPDPYYGNGSGIWNDVLTYQAEVPTVDVKVSGVFEDETNKKVLVKASTEFLTNCKGYTIAFVLTADGLSGTTSAWKQSNYYYSNPATGDPNIDLFCRGGQYGQSSVALVFDDVMIGSTYSSGKTLVPAPTVQSVGTIAESEYTVAMPTKAILENALQYDKIYVTALVIDDKGCIANSARSRVLGAGEKPGGGEGGEIVPGKGIISPISEDKQFLGEAMSPNCKFVAGTNYAGVVPAIWDVEEDAIISYPKFEEGAFHGINNSGFVVGDDGVGEGFAIAIRPNHTELKLYRFEGETMEVHDEFMGDYTVSTGDAGSAAYAVSEDGKTIAGFYFKSDYSTYPCIWNENGERTDLPVPSMEEAGFLVNGAEARWMTPDAKVIAGFLIDDFSTWPAAIWRLQADGSYKCEVVCKDFFETDYQMGKPYMVFTPGSLSENGEWLSVSLQPEFDGFDFNTPLPALQAGRLNLNTGKLEVCESIEGMSVIPTGIANNGAMTGYSYPSDQEPSLAGRSPLFFPANSTKSAELYCAIGTLEALQNVMSNAPFCISADGLKVQGFAISNDTDVFSYIAEVIDPTGIETLPSANAAAVKGAIYNLAGQQVRDANAHGLYIIDGKKIMK